MAYCKHTCIKCGESWDCGYPFFSEEFYERLDVITAGTYCNSYCPSCEEEARLEIKNLFNNKKSLSPSSDSYLGI